MGLDQREAWTEYTLTHCAGPPTISLIAVPPMSQSQETESRSRVQVQSAPVSCASFHNLMVAGPQLTHFCSRQNPGHCMGFPKSAMSGHLGQGKPHNLAVHPLAKSSHGQG